MRRWMVVAAVAALVAVSWWHWPAVAQRGPDPATASEAITFEQYRDFRNRDFTSAKPASRGSWPRPIFPQPRR
jgi:hypothetical protein